MFTETLYPKTKQILEELQNEPYLENFYLAGGTALALQIGHRKSSDLDWFTSSFPKLEILIQNLLPHKPQVTQMSAGTLDTLINNTKVSFLEYTYPLVTPMVNMGNVMLASVMDTACMKITAISSRGSKKDFIDLYSILETHSLSEILTAFEKKYEQADYNKMHVYKSLIYFTDAETDPEPDYLKPIEWETVKQKLISVTEELLKSQLAL